MANWREISRIAHDPQAARMLAKRLLKLSHVAWSEYCLKFLVDIAEQSRELTTRQAEFLIDLRNESELHSKVGGFSVPSLIDDCWRNRDPDRHGALSEENCAFIESLRGKTSLARPQLLRLLACCRELGLIEKYIDIAA